MAINTELLQELEHYLQGNRYILEAPLEIQEYFPKESQSPLPWDELEGYMEENQEPTLQELLFQYIDRGNWKDADIYKRAGLDRKHFSKIRSNPEYKISKPTALALAIALELDYDEAEKFLSAAGYALSSSNRSDLIIQFFIEKQLYDLYTINEALDYFSLKPIGGV